MKTASRCLRAVATDRPVRYRRPLGLVLVEAFGEDACPYALYSAIYGRVYGFIMRVAHRFGWHKMKTVYPDGDEMVWCQWCGLRSRVPE